MRTTIVIECLALVLGGCGDSGAGGDAANDGALPGDGPPADAGVADGPSPDLDAGLSDGAAGSPAPSCQGVQVNGSTPVAIVEATVTAEGPPSGRPSCEGDHFFTIDLARVLCGPSPTGQTLVANSINPSVELPRPGERALLLLSAYPCPKYPAGSALFFSGPLDPGAWNGLAEMLVRDGGARD